MEGNKTIIPRRNPTRATKSNRRYLDAEIWHTEFPIPLASSFTVDAHSSLAPSNTQVSSTPNSASTLGGSAKSVSNSKNIPKSIPSQPKSKKSKEFIRFRFQIDCSEAVDVTDKLVNFMKSDMKVDSKKKNLDDVSIDRRNTNVNILARVMVKKKYLKLLTKRFLRKNKMFNYRVIQKNKRSYKIVQKSETPR